MEDAINVKEETEGDLKKDEEDEKPGDERKPQLEPILTLDTDSFFMGNEVRGLYFFPLYKDNQVLQEPETKGVGQQAEDEAKGVRERRLLLQKWKAWALLPHRYSSDFSKQARVVILGLSGLMDLYDEICCNAVTATQLFRWSLPASASAFALDDDRSILVIGSRDGTLCMWNQYT